jgi:hypothetical protein
MLCILGHILSVPSGGGVPIYPDMAAWGQRDHCGSEGDRDSEVDSEVLY